VLPGTPPSPGDAGTKQDDDSTQRAEIAEISAEKKTKNKARKAQDSRADAGGAQSKQRASQETFWWFRQEFDSVGTHGRGSDQSGDRERVTMTERLGATGNPSLTLGVLIGATTVGVVFH
jgi:hypothetical protein